MSRKPAYGASIRERAEEFVDVIAGLDASSDEYPALCRELWDKESSIFAEKSPTTQKQYVTRYRNAIRDRLGEDAPALEIVKMSAAATDAINAAYTARIAYDNRNLLKIDHWRDLVAVAHEKLRSKDPLTIIAALALLTGRRSYELMCLAEFGYRTVSVEHGSIRMKYEVEFSGQAKTRGRTGTKFEESYPIPVLAPASSILSAYLVYRSSSIGQVMREAENSAFASRYTAKLNEIIMRDYGHFWPAGESLSIKCFRPLYAEIAFKTSAPKGVSKNAFFASILGHKADDLTTALSYFDYYLDEKDRFDTIKLRESIQTALREDKETRDKLVTPPWRAEAAEAEEAKTAKPAPAPPTETHTVKKGRGRPKGAMSTTQTRRAMLAYIRQNEPVRSSDVPVGSDRTIKRLVSEGLVQRIAWADRPKRSRVTQIVLTEKGRNVLDDMRFEEEHPPAEMEQEPVRAGASLDLVVAQKSAISEASGRERTPAAAHPEPEAIERPKRPRKGRAIPTQKRLFDEDHQGESPASPERSGVKDRRRKKEPLPHEKRKQRRSQASKSSRRR